MHIGPFVCITAGSDLLSYTGFPCSGFSYSSRCARGGGGCAADGHAWETVWMTVAAVQTKRPDAYRAFGVRLTAGSDLLSHTGFPCSGFSYSSRCARGGGGCPADGHAWETVWMTVAAVQTKRPDAYRAFCLYYCRQRPTLPHRFPMQWLFLQLALRARRGRLRRRWARMGNCVDNGRCRTNKKARCISGLLFVLLPAATYSPTPVSHAVAFLTARAAPEAGAAAPPMGPRGELCG